MPGPDQLRRFRAAVDDGKSGPELESIVAALRKGGYEVGATRSSRRRPRATRRTTRGSSCSAQGHRHVEVVAGAPGSEHGGPRTGWSPCLEPRGALRGWPGAPRRLTARGPGEYASLLVARDLNPGLFRDHREHACDATPGVRPGARRARSEGASSRGLARERWHRSRGLRVVKDPRPSGGSRPITGVRSTSLVDLCTKRATLRRA